MRNILRIAKSGALFKLWGRRNLVKVSHRITHRCNLDCSFCDIPSHRRDELSKEEIIRMIEEIASMGCSMYTISGGEPLILPYISEILEKAKSEKIVTKLVTNGTLLNSKLDEISPYLDVLIVSLDSSRTEVHEGLRGQYGIFDKVVTGIKSAIKNGNLTVGINMILARENMNHIRETCDFVMDLGVKSISFGPIHKHYEYRSPKRLKEDFKEIYGGFRNFQRAIDEFIKLKKEGYPITHSDLYLRSLKSVEYPSMDCVSGFLSCDISPDGRLTPCGFREESTSSFAQKDFRSLWKELKAELDWVKNCKGCFFHCYFEPNAIFSFRYEALKSYGGRYMKSV